MNIFEIDEEELILIKIMTTNTIKELEKTNERPELIKKLKRIAEKMEKIK